MKKKLLAYSAFIIATMPFMSHSADVSYSIGAGIPFFLVPEISLASSDGSQRWYANYKLSLDDGFSIGFEQSVSDNNKHAIGLLIGALGIQDDDRPCHADKKSDNDLADGVIDVIACSVVDVLNEVLDEETVNGLGVSYSYNFSGLNQAGMRIRMELGYGEGTNSNEKNASGGINFSYQF